MALSGVHVACGFVGGSRGQVGEVPIARKPAWSQTFAAGSPGSTSQTAPKVTVEGGRPSFEIRASLDIYVAIGAAPDPSQVNGLGDSARIFVPAGETRNIFCDSGDKLAWIAA